MRKDPYQQRAREICVAAGIDPENRKLAHGKPCPYCERQMNLHDFHLRPTWDHVVPVSRGGREKIVCCHKCNGLKGNMLPEQWIAYMAANPKWWLLSKSERRARNRAARLANPDAVVINGRLIRRAERQGSPPPGPVIVPPELIFSHIGAVLAPVSALRQMTAEENERRLAEYNHPAALPNSASS